MRDDLSDILAYYNSDPGQEQNRLERHQLEYDLTWRYLAHYLPPRGAILEIGAATGAYTVELVRRGFRVTAVDLSAELLALNLGTLAKEGLLERAKYVVSDARDLAEVNERDFDAALLMGPLYHLTGEADRRQAIQEVHGRLREGGIIFSAFISRLGIMGDVMKDIPEWIEDQRKVRAHLDTGRRPDGYPPGGFRGYFATVPEIAPLHEGVGFETLVVAAVEPAISADDESYSRLRGEQRQLWLDLLQELSTEPSVIGASRHLLYVGRKREEATG